MSLVEIIVALGIMGILMAAMITMQVNQNRENRALAEHLSALDLQRSITQTLANASVCNFIFADTTNASSLKDSAGAAATPPNAQFSPPSTYPLNGIFTLSKILSSPSATAPPIAEELTQASVLSNSLKIQSMRIDLIGVGATDQYLANIVVNFNQPSVLPGSPVRQIKSLNFPINLLTQTSGTDKKVTACSSVSSGGIGVGQTWQNVTGTRAFNTVFTNSTGKPIMIAVSVGPNPNPGWGTLNLQVDGVQVGYSSGNWNGGSGFLSTTAIVPDGSNYQLFFDGRLGINSWAELR